MSTIINETMLSALDRVMRLMRRIPTKQKNNIGRGVYRLLTRIQNNPGISTRELANRMEIRPSSLNERLSKLEEAELITRTRDENDQRVFIVNLLPKGEEHLDLINEEREIFNQSISQILSTEEANQLTELVNKLSNGIEALNNTQKME